MQTPNRSSYWTLDNGKKIRVKHMTDTQVHIAMIKIETLECDESSYDPYIIHTMCETSEFCRALSEPEHKKFGFFLEDWHNLFRDEIIKRVKLLKAELLRLAPKSKKPNFLVNWFKLW